MRSFINILNEDWFDTVQVYGKDVDLYKNPTRSEWFKLFRQYPEGMRGHILVTGELIVWDAMHATHSDISPLIGSATPGYRYFLNDSVMFNDLNWELNDEEDPNAEGEIPRYGWYVSKTYDTTVSNKSVQAYYSSNPRIIGVDTDVNPSPFEIDSEWVAKNCALPKRR